MRFQLFVCVIFMEGQDMGVYELSENTMMDHKKVIRSIHRSRQTNKLLERSFMQLSLRKYYLLLYLKSRVSHHFDFYSLYSFSFSCEVEVSSSSFSLQINYINMNLMLRPDLAKIIVKIEISANFWTKLFEKGIRKHFFYFSTSF